MSGERKRVLNLHENGGNSLETLRFLHIMSPVSISISFIRNTNSPNTDDIVSIVPNKAAASMLFDVVYRDRFNGTVTHSTVPTQDIFDFLENIFTLLTVDEDPYTFIQIITPSFPSVLLSVGSLKKSEIRTSIMTVVNNIIRNWPKTSPIPLIPNRPITRSMTSASFT